jgi:hypothetical protein
LTLSTTYWLKERMSIPRPRLELLRSV